MTELIEEKNGFTITSTGKAFISLDRLALLCGVTRSDVIGATLKACEQIEHDTAINVILAFVVKGEKPALQTLNAIGGTNGLKAYIYQQVNANKLPLDKNLDRLFKPYRKI